MNIHRHGDVVLKPIAQLPNKKGKKVTKHILAYGEFSGHSHVLTAHSLKVIEVDGKTYLDIGEPGTLTHEEHKTQTIQPGKYEVVIKREYDYFAKSLKQVVD